jgi:hypothetical protein|eukprot:COSAG01_NODE_473_length_16542_cov_42.403651_3_plen_735_part_00
MSRAVLCVRRCPTATGDIVCDCGYCNNGTTTSQADMLLGLATDPAHFTFNILPTKKTLLFCGPAGNLTEAEAKLMNENEWLKEAVTDLHENWSGVAWGALASFLMGFIFLYAVAWLTKPLTYLILAVIMVASFALFWISLFESNRLPADVNKVFSDIVKTIKIEKYLHVPSDLEEPGFWVDVSIGLWGSIFAVSLIVVLALRQRLAIAIGVVEESSRALTGMPTLLLVPLGTLLSTVLVILGISGPSIFFTISLREWDGSTYVYPQDVKIMLAVLGFGTIWVMCFIDSVQFTAIAGAVCDWYFTPDKSKRAGPWDASKTLFRSYYRLVRFHLGSMAFGSLVVATVKAVQYVLAYVSAQIQAQFPNNRAIKILLAIMNCLVACFERLIKFLTQTAFIQVALWGTPFCTSAISGFKLAVQNLGRLAFVTIMSKCLVFLGKLEIALASAATCALFIWQKDQTGKGFLFWLKLVEDDAEATEQAVLHNNLTGDHVATIDNLHVPKLNNFSEAIFRAPVAIALVVGYFIGFVFMDCFDVTIHTIIVCFCEDEKHCDGGDADLVPDDYPYYAAGSLEEVLGPAIDLGRKKKVTSRSVKKMQLEYKKDLEQLKQRQEMDSSEKDAAGVDENENFDEKRKALQDAAEAEVAKLKVREKAELDAVAKQVKNNKARKQMRKAGAPSQRNLDRDAFIKRYEKELKKKGLNAAKEFDKLDVDKSGDLSAAELEKFSQMRVKGKHDV